MRFYFLPPELPVLLMVPIKCVFFQWHDKLGTCKRRLVIGRRYLEIRASQMADPGKQLPGQISACISNILSPYLDHMICIWVGMDSDNRIGQKRSILCKREGSKSRRDVGFSPAWFCHEAGSSIPGCRYLIGNASIPSLDFILTITQPTYFIYLYIHPWIMLTNWKPLWAIISLSIGIYDPSCNRS